MTTIQTTATTYATNGESGGHGVYYSIATL